MDTQQLKQFAGRLRALLEEASISAIVKRLTSAQP